MAVVVMDPEELEQLVENAVRRAVDDKGPSVRLLKHTEVAEICGVHPRTVMKWAKHRGLPGHRLGDREVRFVESEVLAWVAEQDGLEVAKAS